MKYFSRIRFNPKVNRQELIQTLLRDTYQEHQALWRLFDSNPDANRDFLYRRVIDHGQVKYYLLSTRIPVDNSGMWLIDTPKPYNPNLQEGQQLYFFLRVNPVITVTDPDGKKRRHDIVMHEKKRIGYRNSSRDKRPSVQRLIQDSCIKWLESRESNYGFSIRAHAVIADGYRQHETVTKNRKRPIRFSTVDFRGLLTVTDPDLFKSALFSGIGKSKAFGCGLLLVRRT